MKSRHLGWVSDATLAQLMAAGCRLNPVVKFLT